MMATDPQCCESCNVRGESEPIDIPKAKALDAHTGRRQLTFLGRRPHVQLVRCRDFKAKVSCNRGRLETFIKELSEDLSRAEREIKKLRLELTKSRLALNKDEQTSVFGVDPSDQDEVSRKTSIKLETLTSKLTTTRVLDVCGGDDDVFGMTV